VQVIGISVGIGKNTNYRYPKFLTGSGNTDGYFTTICNQYLLKHFLAFQEIDSNRLQQMQTDSHLCASVFISLHHPQYRTDYPRSIASGSHRHFQRV
jgi:hypothetical protein